MTGASSCRPGKAGFTRDQSLARRARFGLDTPLPADPRVVERAILRFLAEQRPALVAIRLSAKRIRAQVARTGRPLDASEGVPDLLVLLGGGRAAFLKIKTQAQVLTKADKAFADLCRDRAIVVLVVRSLAEARDALDCLCQQAGS